MSKKVFYEAESISFLQDLQALYSGIKKEFFETTSSKDYQKMRLKSIYNEGWTTFGLRWFRRDLKEAHAKCPLLSGLIKQYDNLVETIGFSIMSPGTIVYPHVGYTDSILRCHLGIEIPEGDCGIRVDTIFKKWQNGVAFVFDDTLDHEAWNKTEKQRIILLADLDRKVLFETNPVLQEQNADADMGTRMSFWMPKTSIPETI